VTRTITLTIALALLAPAIAAADDPPPPTPAQLEQAKKAFNEGKKLHEAGKHAEAVEKFKESYRLSKNPLLLYNIAFTFDEAKEEDMALFYYRKFLKDAPPDAAQRPLVTDRVKALEKQFNPGGATETTPPPATPDPATATTPAPKKPEAAKPLVIKPVGTYTATDFQHQVVETAPPGKPLDVTAFVPEDSGFVVTLFYRTAGEGKFTGKAMFWRYKELVARIPAPKMIGNAVQYYIEVKDTAGTVVTRSAKATSPNLVNLEAGAPPRFYPDLTEEGDARVSDAEIQSRDEEEDPINRTKKAPPKVAQAGADPAASVYVPPPGPNGLMDVGSQKFFYAKWGTTALAGVSLVGGLVFYLQARRYAGSLEDDSASCGAPPCRKYDTYAADVQATGQRYQTLSYVSAGVGVLIGGAAGYLWYRERFGAGRSEHASTRRSAKSWAVVPVAREGFAGATAATRF
jgi:tetratricopeptide (TPR) repeat protein